MVRKDIRDARADSRHTGGIYDATYNTIAAESYGAITF